MKKIVSIICAFVTTISFGITTSAYEIEQETTKNDMPETVYAELVSDTGETFLIQGHLVNGSQKQTRTMGSEFYSTYEFGIPMSFVYEESDVKSQPDTTYSSTVTLTIFYKYYDTSSGTAYLLTKVTGSWAIQDISVSVTQADLSYGCSGVGITPGTYIDQNQEEQLPAYSGGFTRETGFTEYVLGDPSFSVVGANLTLAYKMRSRTWTFSLQNNRVG